jgi:transcriptional regulator with XRE-family HTH domain
MPERFCQEEKRYPNQLRILRFLSGLSQEQLAVRVGVDQAIIGRIERGAIRGTPLQRKRLAEILEVGEDTLFPSGQEK